MYGFLKTSSVQYSEGSIDQSYKNFTILIVVCYSDDWYLGVRYLDPQGSKS